MLLAWSSFVWVENAFRYSRDFRQTIVFLIVCVITCCVVFLVVPKNEESSLSNLLSKASGTNFRCDIASYRPYGSSRACVLTNSQSAKETVAIIGNSHAQMYAPLVVQAVPKDVNVLLVPLGGCLPTTSINNSEKCLAMARENLDSVLADDTVQNVVIGMTWYANEYLDKNGNIVSSEMLPQAVERLISEIQKHGKKPILFSPIPIPGKDYASELARLLRFGKIDEEGVYSAMKIPRSIYETQFAYINDILISSMQSSYIEVYKEICDDRFCYFGKDDIFFFADSNHLSEDAVVKFSGSRDKLVLALGSSGLSE